MNEYIRQMDGRMDLWMAESYGVRLLINHLELWEALA